MYAIWGEGFNLSYPSLSNLGSQCSSSFRRLACGVPWGTWGVLVLLSVLLSVNCNAPTGPVFRKGVTLAGDYSQFTASNFAILHQILNTRAGVIGVNLPWDAATTACQSGCTPQRPSNPTDWNDPQYSNSPTVQVLDAITGYVSKY